MITVTKGIPAKKPSEECIAKTDKDDYAFFIRKCDDDEAPGSDGFPVDSFSGDIWHPEFSDRMTMFIAGTPGAGKSYLAKEMIKLFPKNYKVLLFTALEEGDGNFKDLVKDKKRFFKIAMTPENLSTFSLDEIRTRAKRTYEAERKMKIEARKRRREEEMSDVDDDEEEESEDPKKIPGIILLFDDVDKIRDKRVENMIFAIMEDALANGRGHEEHDGNGDLHVLCTSHALNDYRKTKYTFENSNYVALFPGSTARLQMYTMFDKLGLDHELCDEMIRLGKRGEIRSIIIHKVAPMYIIFGNHIMLI